MRGLRTSFFACLESPQAAVAAALRRRLRRRGGVVSAAVSASAAVAVVSWESQPMITPIRSLMISRVFPELCARDLLELDAEKIQVRQTS